MTDTKSKSGTIWILEQNLNGTWTYGGYRLYTSNSHFSYGTSAGDCYSYPAKHRFFAWRSGGGTICKTRSEAILKFDIERPGEKLFKRKDCMRLSFDSEEEFMESLEET